jgi:hypothetical protein
MNDLGRFSGADPGTAVRMVQGETQRVRAALETFERSAKAPNDQAALQATHRVACQCLRQGQTWRGMQDWVAEVLPLPPEERDYIQADLDAVAAFDTQCLPDLSDTLQQGAQVLMELVPKDLPTPAACSERVQKLEEKIQQPLPNGNEGYRTLLRNYRALEQEARQTAEELKLILSQAPSPERLSHQGRLSELESAWKDHRIDVERALRRLDSFPERIAQAIEEIERRICERDQVEEPLLQGELWKGPQSAGIPDLEGAISDLVEAANQMRECLEQLQSLPVSNVASRVFACTALRNGVQQVQRNVQWVLGVLEEKLRLCPRGPSPARDAVLALQEKYQSVAEQLDQILKEIEGKIVELRGT